MIGILHILCGRNNRTKMNPDPSKTCGDYSRSHHYEEERRCLWADMLNFVVNTASQNVK